MRRRRRLVWRLQGRAVDALCRPLEHYAEAGEIDQAVAVGKYPLYSPLRALELVASDSHEAGHLFSRYGEYLQAEMGDYEAAQQAFNQALAVAQREGDTGLEMRTLVNAARADFYQQQFQEAIWKARRAIELSPLVNEPYAELEAHRTTARALTTVGDFREARQHTEALLPLAESLRDQYWLVSAYQINSSQYCLVGEWQLAREFSDRGLLPQC